MGNNNNFCKERLKDLQQVKKEITYRSRSTSNFIKPNGRSADFTSSIAYGCLEACSYCYVQRHNLQGNPLTLYTNLDELIVQYKKHIDKLPYIKPIGFKPCPSKYPNGESDTTNYTYDIGESSDLLHPKAIPYLNKLLAELVPYSLFKPTLASKICNVVTVSKLIDCPIKGKARIRASVAPQSIIDGTELFTAKVKERILGLNLAVDKGYEGHLNFSPIVLTQTWQDDYRNLMTQIDTLLSDKAKAQVKCEVIFLTHHRTLSMWNREHFPIKSEELLWKPALQEGKQNQRGSSVLRYNWRLKQQACRDFSRLMAEYLPYAPIRYMF